MTLYYVDTIRADLFDAETIARTCLDLSEHFCLFNWAKVFMTIFLSTKMSGIRN